MAATTLADTLYFNAPTILQGSSQRNFGGSVSQNIVPVAVPGSTMIVSSISFFAVSSVNPSPSVFDHELAN